MEHGRNLSAMMTPVYPAGVSMLRSPVFSAPSDGRLTLVGGLSMLRASALKPLTPLDVARPAVIATSSAEGGVDLVQVMVNAKNKALRGGLMGMASMVINVCALMWMRTTINYQYRYGGTMMEALKFLYKDGGGGLGGIRRFYRGLGPALIQGPLSRFGDTAGNDGFLALMDGMPQTKELPTAVKTVGASASAAGFRCFLMPVDALKTTLQVEGSKGLTMLSAKIAKSGPQVLWHGAIGAMSATFVGHYPWFVTKNTLDVLLPKYDRKKELFYYLCRNAVVGFCASAVSDTVSNSIRVLKTTVQTSEVSISYMKAATDIIAKDGYYGLFFRGLGTKILSNGINGLMFNVLWTTFKDMLDARDKAAAAAAGK